MYSMQDGQRYDFSTMYSAHDGRGDSFPARHTTQDNRRDSFPPRYPMQDGRGDTFQPSHTMHDDLRDSFPPRQSMQDGRGDGFLSRHTMQDDRMDSFSTKHTMPNGRGDDFPVRHTMPNGRGDDFPVRHTMPNGRGDEFPVRHTMQDDRRDSFPPRLSMQNGRGDDFASRYTVQDGRGDSFSMGSKGLSLVESPAASGWSSPISSIMNPISSLVGSMLGRDSNSKARAEGGSSPGGIREPPSILGASAYYSGQDSGYSSQPYNSKPPVDFGSRDINGSHIGKADNTLALYDPHPLAIYDPQLSVARKEVKELESALADRGARIESLESSLDVKKTFIEHMEKDFREVTKSLYLKEMRIKDLEAHDGAHQVKMKEKEQEARGLLQRLEKAQSDCAGKDAKIKELQSSLQDVRREIQQLRAWKVDQEKKREADLIAAEQLNTKLSELTTANGQSESKKQQLAKQVNELTQRVQDLKQEVAAQEVTVGVKDLEAQSLRDRLREEQEKSSKISEELEQRDLQVEELIQFVEDLEQQSLALQAQVSAASTVDQEQLKARCAALEEQVGSHELETQNLRARLREEWETTSKLNERLQQCDLQIDDLKNQIEELENSGSVEILQTPKDYIGRDLFIGAQATPNLLEGVLQRVHEVAGIFARLLMKAMEQGKIDGMAVARNNFVRSVSLGKAAPLKYVLEAITCKLLFRGFEHECFDLQDSTSGFMDTEKQRIDNFRQYKQLCSMDNTEQLVHTGDGFFAHFCRIKLEDLSDTIPEISSMVKEIISLTFERSFSNEDTSTEVTTYLAAKLGTTFVQLAVCVWQVHKLAFSFNPVARIFRVSQSEKFVEKYMESVIFQESESEEEDMPSSDISRVDFMVVPGFLVDKVVVRSRVFVVTKPVTSSVRLPIRTT